MSVAPFKIDGGNAAVGGQASSFLEDAPDSPAPARHRQSPRLQEEGRSQGDCSPVQRQPSFEPSVPRRAAGGVGCSRESTASSRASSHASGFSAASPAPSAANGKKPAQPGRGRRPDGSLPSRVAQGAEGGEELAILRSLSSSIGALVTQMSQDRTVSSQAQAAHNSILLAIAGALGAQPAQPAPPEQPAE